MTTTITASARVQALHQWLGAPARRAYLRSLHRHIFIVEAELELEHSNREVEFHDLGEALEVSLRGLGEQYHPETTLVSFGARSCEMLAAELKEILEDQGYAVARVTVSEDGEHSGTVR